MTVNNHDDIATNAAANAATFNAPLGQLDAVIGSTAMGTTATTLKGAIAEHETQIAVAHNDDGTHKTGSITNDDLATDAKVGSLAALATTDKTDSVAAINETLAVANNALATAAAYSSLTQFADDFARADGALGNAWSGATWTIASGKALNTPADGANAVTNGTFAVGTGWGLADGWSIAGGVAVRVPGAGYNLSQSCLTIGRWYKGVFDITAQAAGNVELAFGMNTGPKRSTVATHTQTRRATNTDLAIVADAAADLSIDNLAMYWLATAELFATRAFGVSDVASSVEVTLPAALGVQSGMVLNLDSASNPQNFVIAYLDGGGAARMEKCVAGTYTSKIVGVITYGAGKELRVIKSGTSYSMYYDGVQVGATQTIADAGIISNTNHGMFSTSPGSTLDAYNCRTAATSSTVVYLGGSITNGDSATVKESTSWRALTRSWLNSIYTDRLLTHVNAGIGGTNSWYGLVRLQADVIALNPQLIFIDFAVNDADGDVFGGTRTWHFAPAAEALIRRLRTALPEARLVAFVLCWPAEYSYMAAATDRKFARDKWVKLSYRYGLQLLRWDTWLEGVLGSGYTDADVEAFISAAANPHPIDAGHYQAYTCAIASLTTLDGNYPGALPDRLYAESEDYEETPIIRVGTDNDGETGAGWSTVATTERQSSTANDTISWTGTFCSFGLDTNYGVGAGTVAWSVDGGAYTNIDLAPGIATRYVTNFASAAHTVTLKVISGTVKINRFLAI